MLDVITNRRGMKIQCFMQAVSSPSALAIVQHGYPSSSDCAPVQAMAEGFNAAGVSVMLLDTTCNDNHADGDYLDMTLQGHIDDFEDAVREIGKTQDLPLIFAGHSAGGHSPLKLHQTQTLIPAMTLVAAPLVSGRGYVKAWKAMLEKRGPGKGAKFMGRWKQGMNPSYTSERTGERLKIQWRVMEDWMTHDLTAQDSSSMNAHIITGSADELTTVNEITAYADKRGLTDNLTLIDGADHGFTHDYHQEYLKAQTYKATIAGLSLNR